MTLELINFIDEFTSSQQFLFLESGLQENAPALLTSFTHACSRHNASSPENLTIAIFDDVLLTQMAQLDVPLAIKRSIPSLLSAFFNYLSSSGHYPPAGAWVEWIGQIDKRYQEKFRDDGTVKGETFKKKYTDVNRNDPCPCGSGKKFKKCCMGFLFS